MRFCDWNIWVCECQKKSIERFGRDLELDTAKLVPKTLCLRVDSGDLISDAYGIRPSAEGMDFVDSISADIVLEMD